MLKEILELSVTEEIKYLGIEITNKRNCFIDHTKASIEK